MIWSFFLCFKQKTAYDMRISDWSSVVGSSDLRFTAGCDVGVGGGPYFQRCQIDRAILAWYVSERRCHGPAGAYPGTDETAIDQGRSKQVLKAPDRAVDQNSAIVFVLLGPFDFLACRANLIGQRSPLKINREGLDVRRIRSEEHTSELQSLMRISYAVFCLKKKTIKHTTYA